MGYSIRRSHITRSTPKIEMWTLIYKGPAHQWLFMWALELRSANNRFLQTLIQRRGNGSTSLTPLENGVRDFLVRKRCKYFSGKSEFSSGAALNSALIVQLNLSHQPS